MEDPLEPQEDPEAADQELGGDAGREQPDRRSQFYGEEGPGEWGRLRRLEGDCLGLSHVLSRR